VFHNFAALGEPGGSSTDVAFSRDGRELATVQRDGTVRLWNVATGREVGVLRGNQASVGCVRYSPDGKLIDKDGKKGSEADSGQ
jgi:WD40 repeat protein